MINRQPAIHIPAISQWDEKINIKLSGFAPGESVEIAAEVNDEADVNWRSRAVFQADDAGEVDPAMTMPLEGTYRVKDQMGLFWSMKAADLTCAFQKKSARPSVFNIEVKQNGNILLRKKIKRLIISETIIREEVNAHGVAGTFFRPRSVEHPPVVIVLGGSDGGLDETTAGMLSNSGYAALALPYFQYGDLPKKLIEIPLEYFQKALAWLLEQDGLNHERIGIFGRSKGGELALLIGSHFPGIRFVISHVGGGIVFQGVGLKRLRQTSSWSVGGSPLPYAPLPFFSFSLLGKWLKQKIKRQPQCYLDAYQHALRHVTEEHPSIIKAERIQGPVLLTSSTDDMVWPSAHMSEMVIERLKKHRFPHFFKHVCLKQAGHHIRPPYFPTTARNSTNIVYGGGTEADALASEAFWRELLQFLKDVVE
ncbi:acyl-CoA thioesterase/bile acid-CoA:amino acid N-acyltransferase family protein [Bacillus sonorensis]|uniref:acyl-CoA thioesterase/bile acid-CoA:amino acid N-acyltransferase family protein n=1 Tax=Bacillus sonorensis TaxID=119858 RepID=UPI002282E681|nr:acyl-CoA thioesterase/bile acid-CoA:amino acid N-acyltransferase family protein [Bacillus sonorensis]MCY8271552.1 acyl-CoA thioesterase/BAAT N-terminal domain-containing protein [Bacillus sonorensis]MCY8604090.1 acyl-CoA thioesterase/BAAT N-terminal domain-containing protein [Bacillus sonorensis]